MPILYMKCKMLIYYCTELSGIRGFVAYTNVCNFILCMHTYLRMYVTFYCLLFILFISYVTVLLYLLVVLCIYSYLMEITYVHTYYDSQKVLATYVWYFTKNLALLQEFGAIR